MSYNRWQPFLEAQGNRGLLLAKKAIKLRLLALSPSFDKLARSLVEDNPLPTTQVASP
jgi:hypothetical protein